MLRAAVVAYATTTALSLATEKEISLEDKINALFPIEDYTRFGSKNGYC